MHFALKQKMKKNLNFYTKTKLTPLEKCEFLAFFKIDVLIA